MTPSRSGTRSRPKHQRRPPAVRRYPQTANSGSAMKVTFCVRGVISPLLANLYMHRFVLGWKKLGLEQPQSRSQTERSRPAACSAPQDRLTSRMCGSGWRSRQRTINRSPTVYAPRLPRSLTNNWIEILPGFVIQAQKKYTSYETNENERGSDAQGSSRCPRLVNM